MILKIFYGFHKILIINSQDKYFVNIHGDIFMDDNFYACCKVW